MTGALAEVNGSPFLLTTPAVISSAVTMDPTGKWIYATSSLSNISNNISAFSLDATTGALTKVGLSVSFPPAAPGMQCNVVTVNPMGKFVYVACPPSSISVFSIDAKTGVLMKGVDSLFTPTASSIYAMTADPTGKFVYMVDSGTSSIFAFSIDATTGALTQVGSSPFLTTAKGQPSSLAITGAIQ